MPRTRAFICKTCGQQYVTARCSKCYPPKSKRHNSRRSEGSSGRRVGASAVLWRGITVEDHGHARGADGDGTQDAEMRGGDPEMGESAGRAVCFSRSNTLGKGNGNEAKLTDESRCLEGSEVEW